MNQKIALFILCCITGLSILLSGCGGTNVTTSTFDVAMSLAPSATNFPKAINDASVATVANPFWIGKTEVPYQLWSTVYNWATANGYTFANPGARGGYNDGTYKTYLSGHETDPVTNVTWVDAIVWCNALTDYYNAQRGTAFGCVYYSGGNIARNSVTTNSNTVTTDNAAKGFRLPTTDEWELAARYQGSDSSNGALLRNGVYWTPGAYASGSTVPSTLANLEETKKVAWFLSNSNTPNIAIYSTQPVGQKTSNKLGLYDMNGNVWEWCFDLFAANRVIRGGFFGSDFSVMLIGYSADEAPTQKQPTLGFRVVRSE